MYQRPLRRPAWYNSAPKIWVSCTPSSKSACCEAVRSAILAAAGLIITIRLRLRVHPSALANKTNSFNIGVGKHRSRNRVRLSRQSSAMRGDCERLKARTERRNEKELN